MRLLVIEDDQELLRSMLKYFDSFGYNSDGAKTLRSAREKLEQHSYDCVVLDLNLPDGNGLSIINFIKNLKKKTGILILSANNSLDDKLDGLELGADDYLTKPFHLAELHARIKSILRRNQYEGDNLLVFNEIEINTDSNDVRVNGNLLKLTKKEYELILFLVTNKNRVVTKQSISDHIWGDFVDLYDSFDFIYSHLKNLRKKIIAQGGNDYIKTVYGIGYKFSSNE